MKEARFHFGNRRSNIQPLSIKHLNLEIPFSWLLRYESLIDELFMYFHPKTLLVRVDSDASKNNFIQVLCKVTTYSPQYFLISISLSTLYLCYEFVDFVEWIKKKCHKRYKCSTYMCWRCLLKDFKILASTTRQGTHQISFGFQW